MDSPILHCTSPRRRRRGALVCTAALGAAAAASSFILRSASPTAHGVVAVGPRDDGQHRRELSVALADGGCRVKRATFSSAPIEPTWQASYPGSGARMTWVLVEALTGILANTDYDNHGRGYTNVVAVKTHYPVNNKRRFRRELDPVYFGGGDGSGRAVVILRNPKGFIPSMYNFAWEHDHRLPNHSTRGPQSAWLMYRSHPGHGVTRQLEMFEEFVDYWMTRFSSSPDSRKKLLLVSYEDITGEATGPSAAKSISHFLGEVEGVEPIEDESVPCVWETVVNYKRHTVTGALVASGDSSEEATITAGWTSVDPMSKRTGPTVRPYTEAQLNEMATTLERLAKRYSTDEDLVRIFNGYIETIRSTPIEEGLDLEEAQD